jgi:predicted O-methyltransferase YrrM
MAEETSPLADEKSSVAAIYEQESIARSYLEKRMQFSWQRMLHRKQVALLNAVIKRHQPACVLEVAPGPARLATGLRGVEQGIMVENSQEMVAIAQERLRQHGLAGVWQVRKGDAFSLGQSIREGAANLVYTFRFLRHFRTAEREHLYNELYKSLAPSGLLVFDVVGAVVRGRVEARNKQRADGEIAIYDVSYSAAEFRREMRNNGFDTLDLVPILRHFDIQSWISYKGDDVLPRLSEWLVNAIELIPAREPLEWVAVCRKRLN